MRAENDMGGRFENLLRMEIIGGQVAGLPALAARSMVEQLVLRDVAVGNASAVVQLTGLKLLAVARIPDLDLAVPKGMTQLATLTSCRTDVTGLSPQAGITTGRHFHRQAPLLAVSCPAGNSVCRWRSWCSCHHRLHLHGARAPRRRGWMARSRPCQLRQGRPQPGRPLPS